MAAGARYGHPVPVNTASVGASASAHAELTARDASIPAPLATGVDAGYTTVAEATGPRDGADQWSAHRAPLTATAPIMAPAAASRPAAAYPSAALRTSVPLTVGSRAPPIA
ncbi:hypothetical protein GCM10023322_04210 [Rugosimonospora acidiphila]|uniref:Uncharacterized protein n=1 Tax=Rugosimonospora acidiphila TaxID=556531 RepID=A0ABP9RHW2_9ACTN